MESTQQKGPGFYEFLVEAELQHYYTSIKSDLKIQNTSQLKYVTDDDLYQLGMSKPEVRRLKKYFNKYYPQNYLSKFKKMLLPPKKDDQVPGLAPSIYDPLEPQLGPRVPNKHIISAENIVVNKELGMGEFGVVQQGVWTNDGDRIQVAIKCLSRERMQSNPIEFLKEAAIMHSIDHEHVVRLYGVVLHTDSLMLVTELAPLRSLLECLKEPSLRSSFPVLTLCDFALQICDGMQYLEAKRLIHRDLAARNILVFSKNKVKISDFGLSRALGQGKDYYQTNFNVHLKLPIAWCAPECISYLRFTSASDVWAYGVTLWEMFSYGFQPWAALTGHQILEAIDEPNYQRLDQPECCPKDYFAIMLRCWAHEPNKRPTFAELIGIIPECRPEQLQAIMTTPPELADPKREFLQYKIGDVITVLDKGTSSNLWKGILPNGKSGLFNPAHTVAYIGTNLPTSNKPEMFPKYGSTRRKLRTEMISSPQGEVKHTGHVGLDGAYFGDLSFLGGSSSDEKQTTQYNHLPRQIVTPYRPHEDLDPLLEPASTNLHASDHISSRQLQHLTSSWEEPHEYHEISDEENLVSPRFEKSFDFGPSLLDEMETMFRNMNSPDHDGVNKCNELRELTSRLGNTNIRPKKQATVKPISAHDSKILDSAIELATEMTARSLNDLDGEPLPPTPASPNKRKFSFRFPNSEVDGSKTERRNFSDEAQSIPDLQQRLRSSLTSLIETPSFRLPLWDRASAELCFEKSREILTKPFPSQNPFNDNLDNGTLKRIDSKKIRAPHNSYRNIVEPPPIVDTNPFRNGAYRQCEDLYHREMANSIALYHRVNRDLSANPFIRPRALSLSEKDPNRKGKTIRERNLRRQSYNPQVCPSSSSDSDYTSAGSITHSDMELRSNGRRRRTLSRLSTSNSSIRSDLLPQSTRKISDLYSIDPSFLHPKINRFRNRVHKNVDLALKSVQKNLATADQMQYLKPDFKPISKSPPPSNLSGLSPTTAARWQHMSDTSSESSL